MFAIKKSNRPPSTIRLPCQRRCVWVAISSRLCGIITVLKSVDQWCSQHPFDIERPNWLSWNRFLYQKATNFLRSEWWHSASLRLWRSPDSQRMISGHAPKRLRKKVHRNSFFKILCFYFQAEQCSKHAQMFSGAGVEWVHWVCLLIATHFFRCHYGWKLFRFHIAGESCWTPF